MPYIEYGVNGKPIFRDFPSVSFSLSHAKGMVAAVISDHEDVGIDIERIDIDRLDAYRAIARSRYFEGEREKLKACEGSELEEIKSFLSIWTQKEAAAKILQISPLSLNTCEFSSEIHVLTAIHDEKYVVSLLKKTRGKDK